MPQVEHAEVPESDRGGEFFSPQKVVEIIEEVGSIKKNVAFEIGAGTGYLTIPLSKIFKKVYAIETSYETAKKLQQRLKNEEIRNVGVIVTPDPPEVDFKIDIAVFSNVLHEIGNPRNYLYWAKRAEFILFVEWKKVQSDLGPPMDDRISLEEILEICEGFEVLKSVELPFHYVAVLKQKNSNKDQ
jgi:SAM-dependent methyltransferase